jgi:hypothetical protein
MGYEAIFEGGYAVFRGDVLTFYPSKADAFVPEILSETAESGINVSNVSGYYNELRYFIDCVKNDAAPSVVKNGELLEVLSLLSKYSGRKRMD